MAGFTESDIIGVVRHNLTDWALYKPSDYVLVRAIDNGWWIGYRTRPENIPIGTTHFDLNILSDICYLLVIDIVPEHCGQGHGSELYERITAIARDLRCQRIIQTPSGKTATGERRSDYLARRGWTLHDGIAEIDLTSDPANITQPTTQET